MEVSHRLSYVAGFKLLISILLDLETFSYFFPLMCLEKKMFNSVHFKYLLRFVNQLVQFLFE